MRARLSIFHWMVGSRSNLRQRKIPPILRSLLERQQKMPVLIGHGVMDLTDQLFQCFLQPLKAHRLIDHALEFRPI